MTTPTHISRPRQPGHQDKLGVAETKLLHTLHWMLLDAAQECNHEAGLGHGWSGSSGGGGGGVGGGGGGGVVGFLQPLSNQGSSSPSGSALGGSGPPQGSGGSAGGVGGSLLLEEDEHTRTKLFHKSMATVELFVFLFAPLIHRIKVCYKKPLDC